MIRKEFIAYNTDASRLIGRVEKVIFPKSVKEVSEIVKITNMDIVPRGAGTGLQGGAVPNTSLVLDMTKMNKIISFNPLKRIIVVEAGIILKELNEKLKSKGYEFPIDPLNKGVCSIGGMVAVNSTGKRGMKYGSIKDWIDEIEFVNGRGEIIKTSKADLMDVCGMEGITGIITSVKIRVLPIIKRSFSVFQSDKLEDVLEVGRRLKSEKEVCSIILLSKQVSKMLNFIEKYNIIVEFDSDRGKIKGKEYDNLLKKLNNLYYTLGLNDYYNSEDPKLFFDKIKEFLGIVESEDSPYFVYVGNGIINVFFKDDEKDKQNRILSFVKRIQAKFGKYGYGLKKKEFLDSFDSKLMQRVKQRQDPLGKLNKGKLIDFSISYVRKTEPKEEKNFDGKIKDSFKEERLEVRPGLGEKITAKNIDLDSKSPEEKISDFIKEVEMHENENVLLDNKKSLNEPFDSVANKKNMLEQQTKLSFAEKKEVEYYAKDVSKEISKESNLPLKPRLNVDFENIKHNIEDKTLDNSNEKSFKKPETSSEERDLINKIMGNRFGNLRKAGDEK